MCALVVSFYENKVFVLFFTLPVDADVESRKIYAKSWHSTKITSSKIDDKDDQKDYHYKFLHESLEIIRSCVYLNFY
jgi:hypothetical protein